MRLSEFLARFGTLDDAAFQKAFSHPFLLQEGKLKLEGAGAAALERQVFLLKPPPSGALLVGRSQAVEVSVMDGQVSSRHAELKETGGRWTLTDCGSTNGTFVDGKQLKPSAPATVQDGTPVRFGPDAAYLFLAARSFLPILRSLQEKHAPQEEGPPRQSVLDAQTEHTGLPVKRLKEALTAKEAMKPARGPDLFLCCENMDGVRVELGKPIIIGRTAGHATMVLPHGEVSRAHAEVLRTESGVTIRDMGSANGTFVCGVRINQTPVPLPLAKAIVIGPFTLQLEGPPSEAGLTVQVDAVALRGTTGEVRKTPVADILQEVEAEQKTGVLSFFGGTLAGRISFRGGRPCTAKTVDGKTGIEAIKALLRVKDGTFSLKGDASAVGPQRIERAFSDLLLEDFLG